MATSGGKRTPKEFEDINNMKIGASNWNLSKVSKPSGDALAVPGTSMIGN